MGVAAAGYLRAWFWIGRPTCSCWFSWVGEAECLWLRLVVHPAGISPVPALLEDHGPGADSSDMRIGVLGPLEGRGTGSFSQRWVG